MPCGYSRKAYWDSHFGESLFYFMDPLMNEILAFDGMEKC